MKRAILAFAALTLAACNTAAPPPVASAPAAVAVTPQGTDLPQGSGCDAHLARYRAVQEQDKAMGHVADKVYAQIQTEIAAAAAECSAGHEAQAEAMIKASEVKHGYPTGI